ncbi:hypothetical protein KIN20_023986 [Parelaphostrongylus tenuis]|uniref:Uncharacterized protein n=1 Tax=Parelaphostrongylus tenuis TaxID=148309 RepID=A0AAD5QTB5_PARTN|nr:hypothetical protein KIN20_023986 [Parelaphostrongylus tenuis]
MTLGFGQALLPIGLEPMVQALLRWRYELSHSTSFRLSVYDQDALGHGLKLHPNANTRDSEQAHEYGSDTISRSPKNCENTITGDGL